MEQLYSIPAILECAHYVEQRRTHAQSLKERIVRDYEVDYNVTGERTMYIDGVAYPISAGSVVFRQPGQVASSEGNCNMYMLTLDFGGTIPPAEHIRETDHPLQQKSSVYLSDILPAYFEPKHSGEILGLYRKLCSLRAQTNKTAMTDHVLAQLIHLLISDAYAAKNHEEKPSETDELILYMNEHYGEKITLQQLSELVHLEKSYLIRKFKADIGQTPFEYLRMLRLSNAKKLLRNTDLPVSDIAFQCGFESASYFTKLFRLAFGCLPPSYRQERR